MPLIIDAKIRGMIIIWMIFRNRCAGIDNHSVIISVVFFSTIPVSGPRKIPKPKPKNKAIRTCAHNFFFIR
jgi:hypothetical protein